MSIPGFQEFMLPLLKRSADGKEHNLAELLEVIADDLKVSAEDRRKLNAGSSQTTLYNRAAWAVTHLGKALLLERTGRGRFRIAPRGIEALAKNPTRISITFLKNFPEYRAFVGGRAKGAAESRAQSQAPEASAEMVATPHERLEAAYGELRSALADDLLERMHRQTPKFFERLVVDVLFAMGYGGSRADAAQVVGKSGDEGIDGIIREDRLGLDNVYIQAKKWDSSIGPREIDRFIGSLTRKRATKGVFITTGTYTPAARKAAQEASARIVLIDGEQLAELMIDHGVGVAEQARYLVKRVDGDYFEEP